MPVTATGKLPEFPARIDVTVGVHADTGRAKHPGGALTLIELAEIHEFGLGVPQRSFIRRWADEHEDEVQEIIEAETAKLLDTAPEVVAERIALRLQSKAQSFIAKGEVTPALDPRTIARKGSSVPLKDTGRLQAAILGRAEVTR